MAHLGFDEEKTGREGMREKEPNFEHLQQYQPGYPVKQNYTLQKLCTFEMCMALDTVGWILALNQYFGTAFIALLASLLPCFQNMLWKC